MAEFKYLAQGNTEVQDKQAEAYLYASSGTTGIAATGVIEGLVVAQTATASGSVLIPAGACLNQASLGQGADRLINPSQKTLDIFTANPMGGLPRNDIVTFDSITTAIIPITGTPNASPTDPTVPATSVALGRLRHAASATTIPTAKIDDLRVLTTLAAAVPYTPPLRTRGSVVNATLGGTSNVIVSHGLGVTPTIIMTNINSAASGAERTLRVSARTSTSFTVLCYYNGIAATPGDTGWSFDWITEA